MGGIWFTPLQESTVYAFGILKLHYIFPNGKASSPPLLMSPKFSFFIPHVLISILTEHIMWWQIEELMTDEMLITSSLSNVKMKVP